VGTPVVSNGRQSNPKQPSPPTARALLKIQSAHGFEKDLRGKVLSFLLVPHVTVDEAIDQVKMLLRVQITLLFLYHCCRLHGGTLPKASSSHWLQPNGKTCCAKTKAENDSRDDSEAETHAVPGVDGANFQT
jgi:hypothetical protein